MGLLDSIVSGALNNMGGKQDKQEGGFNPALLIALAPIVIKMLSNNSKEGGLGGLASMFGKADLGNVLQSWIGNGQNMPISADQVGQVFGNDMLGNIAKQAGLDQNEVAGGLAQMLPQIINHLTPQGQAPAGGLGTSDELMGTLGSLLGGGQQGGGIGYIACHWTCGILRMGNRDDAGPADQAYGRLDAYQGVNRGR